MAVQAQYPSNVLLLDRNNAQEINDCSLQPQPGGGGFIEQQPHMLFTNGGAGTNQRKRGREVVAPANFASMNMNVNSCNNHNPYSSMQLQPPTQLIDLTQLHNNSSSNHHHQSNIVSTGLRLSFGEHLHHHHPHQHQHQPQQQQALAFNSSSLLSLQSSEDFASQIKHQRDEIDQFLHAQGEHLRRTLAEKRQRHYRALLSVAEEFVARRLREKEAEMEKATRRYAELEARAAQLTIEAQVWQAKARAQEATAASLQAQLQQIIMSGPDQRVAAADDGAAGGSGSIAGAEGGQAEDAESAYVDPDRVVALGPSCKACGDRVAMVVLLPCRHLCLCTECDKVVQACPLCFSVRNSSVEVYLS